MWHYYLQHAETLKLVLKKVQNSQKKSLLLRIDMYIQICSTCRKIWSQKQNRKSRITRGILDLWVFLHNSKNVESSHETKMLMSVFQIPILLPFKQIQGTPCTLKKKKCCYPLQILESRYKACVHFSRNTDKKMSRELKWKFCIEKPSFYFSCEVP